MISVRRSMLQVGLPSFKSKRCIFPPKKAKPASKEWSLNPGLRDCQMLLNGRAQKFPCKFGGPSKSKNAHLKCSFYPTHLGWENFTTSFQVARIISRSRIGCISNSILKLCTCEVPQTQGSKNECMITVNPASTVMRHRTTSKTLWPNQLLLQGPRAATPTFWMATQVPPFCCLERCCRLNAKDFSSLGNSPSATHLPLFLPPFGTWELSLLKKRIPPPQRRKEPKNDSKIHITSFAPKHIVGVWMELRS